MTGPLPVEPVDPIPQPDPDPIPPAPVDPVVEALDRIERKLDRVLAAVGELRPKRRPGPLPPMPQQRGG